MNTRTKANQQKVLEELAKTPIIQVAAAKTGVSRMTIYRWAKADEEFAEKMQDAIDHGASIINDMAESQLISAIKDRNLTAIIYWLKNRHPAYETRIKVNASLHHEPEELTPEQAELVKQALLKAGLLPLEQGVTDGPEQ